MATATAETQMGLGVPSNYALDSGQVLALKVPGFVIVLKGRGFSSADSASPQKRL